MRQRCYECRRPREQCFCHAIPRIENKTDILILQHIRESRHSFNSARIVHKALARSELVIGDTQQLATMELPIAPGAGLLYPVDGAPCLSELSPDQRPQQLIIIDGTWHQAKTILRDVAQLSGLACYRLSPSAPSQYRIRLEPSDDCISTLEATVAALEALEPETSDARRLLDAFDCMIDNQLNHRGSRVAIRLRKNRGAGVKNFPSDLRLPLDRMVVVYGEEVPGRRGKRKGEPYPVNWLAHRLGTGERFSACLQHDESLSDSALGHMRLSRDDLNAAISAAQFTERWNAFARVDDVLIVYHDRTLRMLDWFSVPRHRSLALKAVFGQRELEFHSIEDLIRAQGIPFPEKIPGTRAEHRLAMALLLTEHLIETGRGVGANAAVHD